MSLLYSQIRPARIFEDDKTFISIFKTKMADAQQICIAVGYISRTSLAELERLAEKNQNRKIILIIGMYYLEGFPEKLYHQTMALAEKWKNEGRGEIRLVIPMKYHGKAYCFYRTEGQRMVAFAGIIGSANLSALKPDALTRRQYELSCLLESDASVHELAEHLEDLCDDKLSQNILEVKNINLIEEKNTSMSGIEFVKKVPSADVEFFNNQSAVTSFRLKLKVPKSEERFLDDGRHFTKSNINVAYAAPRSKKKNRDWFEMQITVGSNIYKLPGYPQKHQPFFILTDDGYWFKAHTTSDNNKQFSAVGDELILGRWLKGRLEAAGLVERINDTGLDKERKGMITQEMLAAYGRDELLFEKMPSKARDEDGNELDVWKLSFEKSKGE